MIEDDEEDAPLCTEIGKRHYMRYWSEGLSGCEDCGYTDDSGIGDWSEYNGEV